MRVWIVTAGDFIYPEAGIRNLRGVYASEKDAQNKVTECVDSGEYEWVDIDPVEVQ